MKGETIKPVFIEKTMNANELADMLDKTGWDKRFTEWTLLEDAATMLRQQQAEIEHLKGLNVLLTMQVNGLRKAQEK